MFEVYSHCVLLSLPLGYYFSVHNKIPKSEALYGHVSRYSFTCVLPSFIFCLFFKYKLPCVPHLHKRAVKSVCVCCFKAQQEFWVAHMLLSFLLLSFPVSCTWNDHFYWYYSYFVQEQFCTNACFKWNIKYCEPAFNWWKRVGCIISFGLMETD